jgi:uncharacterized protein
MPVQRVFDFLTFLGKSPFGEFYQSPGTLLELMDENQIDQSVVAPFTDTPGPDERAHLALYETCLHFPNRFVPFARIDPRYGKKAQQELLKAVTQWGFKGLVFNPVSTDSLPYQPGVVFFMEGVAELNLPVIIPAGQAYVALPEQIAYLAMKVPALKVIIGHMGTAAHAVRTIELMASTPNLCLETSIQQSPYRISLLTEYIRRGRVMFGSASPYSHPEVELLKIRSAGLPADELDMVLSRNARAFLNLNAEAQL